MASRPDTPEPYGSYQEPCQQAAVDVVDVAAPNVHRHEHTTLALESGRGVLVRSRLRPMLARPPK
ncbi:MAG: hypothetical protein JXA67_21665 [Micromonosporaceae bacterium]|nr:hypothetical protein [Micromonosporaceae bacterium]